MRSKLSADPAVDTIGFRLNHSMGIVLASKSILVTARCVMTRDGAILVQRGKRGYLRLPGGRPENRETLVQCLEREMFEELGVEVKVGRLLYIVETFYEKRGELIHEIGFYFQCHCDNCEPEPRENHIVVEWLPLNDSRINELKPRALAGIIRHDYESGWRDNPRYLVSFEDERQ